VVLPFVILIGAAMLGVSEFMVAFEFTPPGGEPLDDVISGDRHGYSMLIFAISAVVATLAAVLTGARPAAYAVAVIGGVALILFLIVDLPDAGKLGDLEDPLRGLASARAQPQVGFWLEAIGTTILALGGAAFATLNSEQLRILGPGTPGDPTPDPPKTSSANT